MKSHKHMYRMQQKQFIVWWKIGLMLMYINIPYVIRTRKRNFLHFYLLLRDHGNSSKVLIYLTLISFFLNLYALARVCLWARTTDAQRGNSLHCTAENSLPLPNTALLPLRNGPIQTNVITEKNCQSGLLIGTFYD